VVELVSVTGVPNHRQYVVAESFPSISGAGGVGGFGFCWGRGCFAGWYVGDVSGNMTVMSCHVLSRIATEKQKS